MSIVNIAYPVDNDISIYFFNNTSNFTGPYVNNAVPVH